MLAPNLELKEGIQKLTLDPDTLEELHNLLYQLNWLNTYMIADKSNGIVNALIDSIDSSNKQEISEAIQTLSRINLSAGLIERVLREFDNQNKF